MQRLLLLGVLLIVGCVPLSAQEPKPKANPVPWSPEMQTIADGNNAFACDLFAQLRTQPGNLFFSPFSIHTALAMTADGATNATLDEMVKVLHLPKDAKGRLAAGDVARYFAAGGNGYELAVANNLWGQKGYPWKADFLERQRTGYGAELTPVDFKDAANRDAARKMINSAIEKQTKDKNKELLKSDDLTEDTRLVLTNAIYFKAQWSQVFNKAKSKDAEFTLGDGSKKKVPLMYQEAHFEYAQADGFKVLEMPYLGNALSMVVLLPEKHDGLPALEKELTAKKIAGWTNVLRSHEVALYLPRFRCESRFPLAEKLKEMGMLLAFNDTKADFSGMVEKDTKGMFLSKVIHQSFVAVDEYGTVAVAATPSGMSKTTVPPPPAVFHAAHPFLYLIRDTKTGTILFMGRYNGP